jgi:hypothetical protein
MPLQHEPQNENVGHASINKTIHSKSNAVKTWTNCVCAHAYLVKMHGYKLISQAFSLLHMRV